MVAYHELAGAGDVSLDIGDLRVRAEFMARRIVYEPGKRFLSLGALQADSVTMGGYLLFAYRLPWYGLEPLLVAEFLRYPNPIFGELQLVPSGGLNVYVNPSTTIRLQYSYVQAVDLKDSTQDHSNYYMHMLTSRLVIAY